MDEASSRTEAIPASAATDPPALAPAVAPGGEAVVVENDAPTYSQRLEGEAPDDEEATGGRRGMFVGENAAAQNYRVLTALSYLLSALVVSGIVFGKVREEGIYADDYLWMRYQTLLTPAPYTDYIWIPLFLLQALFIYGSLIPFKHSPLVGYAALSTPIENAAERTKTYVNCPVIHYPGMCAMSIFMVYSYDREHVLFASAFALSATVICSKICMLQLQALADADDAAASDQGAGGRDSSEIVRGSTANPLSVGFLREYVSLRLPFELFGGYSLCLAFAYLNAWLHVFGLNSKALFVAANTCTAAVLVVAAYVLWGLKRGNGRHLYGMVASMVWYLVGVAVELQAPTQPIYNQFSDEQIMVTQVLAAMASTALSSMLALRMIKTVIKRNLFNCMGMGACQGKDEEMEDEITTGYVHA